MRPYPANVYTLLIDAAEPRPAAGYGDLRSGARAGVDIAAIAYRIVCAVSRVFERPRFRSAAFADRTARPTGRAI